MIKREYQLTLQAYDIYNSRALPPVTIPHEADEKLAELPFFSSDADAFVDIYGILIKSAEIYGAIGTEQQPVVVVWRLENAEDRFITGNLSLRPSAVKRLLAKHKEYFAGSATFELVTNAAYQGVASIVVGLGATALLTILLKDWLGYRPSPTEAMAIATVTSSTFTLFTWGLFQLITKAFK